MERRWIAAIIVLAMATTSIPLISAVQWAGSGEAYSGIRALIPGDVHVYYSYLKQVEHGNVLFSDLYTSEPQPIRMFRLDWLLVGWMGRLFHLSPVWTFQLARILVIPFFVAVLYAWCIRLFSRPVHRLGALALILFSSGWGGWWVLFRTPPTTPPQQELLWPMDLWVSESNNFLSMVQSPHFMLSTMFVSLVFLWTLKGWETKQWRWSLAAAAAGLIFVLFHPFHVPMLVGVLVVAFLVFAVQYPERILDRGLRLAIVLGGITLAALYYVFLLSQDPLTAGRAAQNILITPRWWMMIIGYGWIFVFAGLGAIFAIVRRREQWVFPILWAAVQIALIYTPLDFQRRLTQGLHVPLALLAAFALFGGWEIFGKKIRTRFAWVASPLVATFVFLVGFAWTNLYMIGRDFALFHDRPYDIFYYSAGMQKTAAWLEEHMKPGEIFLAHPISANLLVGMSGRGTYVGHGVETLRFYEKAQEAQSFYSTWTPEERGRFLTDREIVILVVGPRERRLGTVDWSKWDFLERVLDTDDYDLYRVNRADSPTAD